MSDVSGPNDHVILMPLLTQTLEKRRLLPSQVDLGEYLAQADQVEVVRVSQLRTYVDRVDRSGFRSGLPGDRPRRRG